MIPPLGALLLPESPAAELVTRLGCSWLDEGTNLEGVEGAGSNMRTGMRIFGAASFLYLAAHVLAWVAR